MVTTPPSTIETSRLALRPPALSDATAIFEEYGQDPDVARFVRWRPHEHVATVEAFLREALVAQDGGSRWYWVVTTGTSDRPIGMIDAQLRDHRFSLGYGLAKRCWGNGYMPEALRPLIDWALHQGGIYRVWAVCDVENHASARVLEKLGMKREGILRRWSLHPNVSDTVPRDCYSYSIVKA